MPKVNTPEVSNKSITKDKLSDEVQNKLNDIGTLSALRTNSKDNLVKAINEVFQSGTNKLSNIISALEKNNIKVNPKTWDNVMNIINKILMVDTSNGSGKTLSTRLVQNRGEIRLPSNSENPKGGTVQVLDQLGKWGLYTVQNNFRVTNSHHKTHYYYNETIYLMNLETFETYELQHEYNDGGSAGYAITGFIIGDYVYMRTIREPYEDYVKLARYSINEHKFLNTLSISVDDDDLDKYDSTPISHDDQYIYITRRYGRNKCKIEKYNLELSLVATYDGFDQEYYYGHIYKNKIYYYDDKSNSQYMYIISLDIETKQKTTVITKDKSTFVRCFNILLNGNLGKGIFCFVSNDNTYKTEILNLNTNKIEKTINDWIYDENNLYLINYGYILARYDNLRIYDYNTGKMLMLSANFVRNYINDFRTLAWKFCSFYYNNKFITPVTYITNSDDKNKVSLLVIKFVYEIVFDKK